MDDPRIVELLTEMLDEQRGMRHEMEQMNTGLERLDVRIERLEKQQRMTNMKLRELTLSNVRLADELKVVVQYGERIVRLEVAVFH